MAAHHQLIGLDVFFLVWCCWGCQWKVPFNIGVMCRNENLLAANQKYKWTVQSNFKYLIWSCKIGALHFFDVQRWKSVSPHFVILFHDFRECHQIQRAACIHQNLSVSMNTSVFPDLSHSQVKLKNNNWLRPWMCDHRYQVQVEWYVDHDKSSKLKPVPVAFEQAETPIELNKCSAQHLLRALNFFLAKAHVDHILDDAFWPISLRLTDSLMFHYVFTIPRPSLEVTFPFKHGMELVSVRGAEPVLRIFFTWWGRVAPSRPGETL